ncbi:AcvB/VirJ family lysyl-phosphatidylglycerol hydrolase [Hufsiella ginkgonis]|uniref:Bacterial virulence domain-containing protein n=1 Tax=Hufsiella ginkgonis TaxID=2695274 RepID=A0A7K1Y0J6_9SPHI|nr:AcvB/VirJ family lysyl-phosphatidylglycerol hydrolase [Hufsiella ginkgonis]MXV16607.1 hypothetical protein [Hufsiella ginkgonis]
MGNNEMRLVGKYILLAVTWLVSLGAAAAELPMVVTPAKVTKGGEMAVMFCGDGGWNTFDQQLADEFAKNGIPVAGINSLKYFWKAKSADQITGDVARVIEKYSALWKKDKVILVGYSFGADVMPFVYNRLAVNQKSLISGMALLSPSKDTDFEIHVSEMLHFGNKSAMRKYNVHEEIRKMEPLKPVCFFGRGEDTVPALFNNKYVCKLVYLEGGHHYEDATGTIVRSVAPND